MFAASHDLFTTKMVSFQHLFPASGTWTFLVSTPGESPSFTVSQGQYNPSHPVGNATVYDKYYR